eukprot:Clim_evm74s109 gene=Clim_evmTU74s109
MDFPSYEKDVLQRDLEEVRAKLNSIEARQQRRSNDEEKQRKARADVLKHQLEEMKHRAEKASARNQILRTLPSISLTVINPEDDCSKNALIHAKEMYMRHIRGEMSPVSRQKDTQNVEVEGLNRDRSESDMGDQRGPDDRLVASHTNPFGGIGSADVEVDELSINEHIEDREVDDIAQIAEDGSIVNSIEVRDQLDSHAYASLISPMMDALEEAIFLTPDNHYHNFYGLECPTPVAHHILVSLTESMESGANDFKRRFDPVNMASAVRLCLRQCNGRAGFFPTSFLDEMHSFFSENDRGSGRSEDLLYLLFGIVGPELEGVWVDLVSHLAKIHMLCHIPVMELCERIVDDLIPLGLRAGTARERGRAHSARLLRLCINEEIRISRLEHTAQDENCTSKSSSAVQGHASKTEGFGKEC